jgi:hypothetical protein
MTQNPARYAGESLETLIFTVRGNRVMLDADLACIYGVQTRRLNEQVRRNAERFPRDFMFQLTRQEAADLKSQIATSSERPIQSRFATDSGHGGRRKLPYAFTEHGAIMAANVLNSPEAIRMSVFVVRAFVKMREALISRSELERRLLRIENVLLAHDESIRELYDQIRPLLLPPPEPPRKKIGFVNEPPAKYGKGKSKGGRKQICDGNI